jgi:hypothetical protein
LTTHPAASTPSPNDDDENNDPLNPNNDDRLFRGSDDDDVDDDDDDTLPTLPPSDEEDEQTSPPSQPISASKLIELTEALKNLASFSQQVKDAQAETDTTLGPADADDTQDDDDDDDDVISFPIHYFTLDEAAAMLPVVQRLLKQAHRELKVAYDEVVLYKRLHTLRYIEREASHEDTESILETKLNHFEATQQRWLAEFASHGVLLRDLQRGVCEFPYKSSSGDEYLLCWKLTDDGIFYFREPNDHPKQRTPISLLPD